MTRRTILCLALAALAIAPLAIQFPTDPTPTPTPTRPMATGNQPPIPTSEPDTTMAVLPVTGVNLWALTALGLGAAMVGAVLIGIARHRRDEV